MVELLGQKRYEMLETRARTFKNRAEAVEQFRIFFGKYGNDGKILI